MRLVRPALALALASTVKLSLNTHDWPEISSAELSTC
jgi:hypothetical protein